jgi:hypothetical protein
MQTQARNRLELASAVTRASRQHRARIFVNPKSGTTARGICCAAVEKKQIPRPINLASE